MILLKQSLAGGTEHQGNGLDSRRLSSVSLGCQIDGNCACILKSGRANMQRAPFDENQLDHINLQSDLSLRKAKRMLEWMRTVYENEASLLRREKEAEENSGGPIAGSLESHRCQVKVPADK
jgi:hypothetical protein